MTIYLPFADGTIGHDCATCGGACCADGHLGSGADQRHVQREFPLIEHFTSQVNDEGFALLAKLKPGCWFLTDQRRCRLELDHGRRAKPFVCRQHPLYVTVLPGLDTALAWLAAGCVWTFDPGLGGDGVQAVTWSEAEQVAEQARRVGGLSEPGPHNLAAAEALTELAPLPELLVVEERLRDRPTADGDLLDHLAWQHAVGLAFAATGRPDARPNAHQVRRSRRQATALRDAAWAYLGLEPMTLSPENTRALRLFGPMLRLMLLGLVPSGGPLTPRLVGGAAWYLRLPWMLLALAIFGAVYQQVDPRRTARLDFNTLVTLWLRFGTRVLALACFGDRLDTDAPARSQLSVRDAGAVQRLLSCLETPTPPRLGDAARRATEGYSAEQRALALDDMAAVVVGVGLPNTGD